MADPRLVPREGRELIWASWPDTRHSSNIAARSAVGFVIFETPVPTDGRTRAVYAEATAAEVSEADHKRCLRAFDHRSHAGGLGRRGQPNASRRPDICGSTTPS